MSFENPSFEKEHRFTITQTGGTEEMPVLTFSRDGIQLEYELDLINQRYRECNSYTHDTDTDTDSIEHTRQDVVPIIQTELQRRRTEYSEYFS